MPTKRPVSPQNHLLHTHCKFNFAFRGSHALQAPPLFSGLERGKHQLRLDTRDVMPVNITNCSVAVIGSMRAQWVRGHWVGMTNYEPAGDV